MAIRIPALGPQNRANNLGSQPVFENFIYVDSGQPIAGSVLSLAMNGSQDGLAVVIPSSLVAAGLPTLPIGILASPPTQLNSNGVIDCVIHGVHNGARVTLGTRAATNAAFGSWSALNPGDALGLDLANNALSKNTGGAFWILQPIQGSTGAPSNFTGGAVQSATVTVVSNINGSMTTVQATQTYQVFVSPGGLAAYVPAKVYVRQM